MNEQETQNLTTQKRVNPFFLPYDTPHDTVPFDRIRLEDYEEAFMEGIRRDNEQIEKTINNPEKPTFDNTIINTEEDEGYYDLLSRVSTVFFNLLSAETNDEMDALAQKMQPILTQHANDVRLNPRLFARIRQVHLHHRKLTPEEKMLLDNCYDGFVRSGALLDDEGKERLRQLTEEASMLSLQFSQNLHLRGEERHNALEIPQETLRQMTTLALVESAVNHPQFAEQAYAFNFPLAAMNGFVDNTALFRELCSRSNAPDILVWTFGHDFPTTLSAMGAEIEGGRLGLGTDLFSDQDTLTEQMGREAIDEELSKTSEWMNQQSRVEPLTADVTYDPYDEENHKLSFTIRNVSSDKVDGFRCCMKMYGYRTPKGSDYIEWVSAVETEKGVWHAEWTLPVDQAYNGIVKLQPTCMVDGARSNVLELHFYHLKYDAGGGNCEWYECDPKGNPLEG